MRITKQLFMVFLIVLALAAIAAAPMAYRINSAINATDDSWVRYGKDINFYSDGSRADRTIQLEGANGDLSMDGQLSIAAQTAITVSNGTVITPTGSYQPLNGSGTITAATIATGSATAGDLVTLVNQTDTTINIADSGGVKLSTAAAIGEYDTLSLLFDGDYWLETGRSNN